MYIRIFLSFISLILISGIVSAAPLITLSSTTNDVNSIRDVNLSSTNNSNSLLEDFARPLRSFFFSAGVSGSDGVLGAFTTIAFQIKNFFIAIAVIFLIVGVIRLLFSSNDEEETKKWRKSIIWVSVGIFVMQIAFSVWSTLILKSSAATVGSSLGWEFWVNIFSPIVSLLQMLAAFGFLLMAVWAFFTRVSAAGDEERIKKSNNTIIYAIIGLLLIKIPYMIVRSFYGRPGCENSAGGFITVGTCDIKEVDLAGGIGIVGKLFTFFNTFLSVICVILVIYAGWLVLISGGDEEKLKKAKSTVLYIIIGFVVLVASHAIFRFFILKG